MSSSGWTEDEKRFSLAPYSFAEAAEIARELELQEPVAIALVRRGLRTVADAREFLAADQSHDPSEFTGMAAATELIRAAVAAGKHITVHGDYDVDGVTSTTILVRAFRELGAECDWLIPGRVEDGYGLSIAGIDRLAERGTQLLITADCGITSVAEVAYAKSLGIEVVVTDHHQPGAELPDCPIVHPVVSGYPCPDLCAGGVAYKVAEALLGAERAERDLDLVALATIADMVPLTGENRSLVRRGLERMRRAPRLGLRALMKVSNVAPERVNETDVSFRLSPRINAAGRLYRADAAVELFLGDDPERAGEIAVELDRANLDRRETEREVLADANRLLAELEAEREPGAAIVLWGEGWHPGVVGICASRMAERHMRPAILIAIDADGRGKGSGRSVPGFDLLGALRACSVQLARFGGHRAAAGLEIEREHLEGFRESFGAHCGQTLSAQPAVRTEEIDAVVGTEALGHQLAAQMARLGPFGMGNPEVRLVVPGARIDDVRSMGEEDRHARFTLRGGPGQVRGVAFGVGATLAKRAAQGPADASIRLELNEWNGATEPRAVLGTLYEPAEAPAGDPWRASDDEWTERLRAALEGPLALPTNTHERPTPSPMRPDAGRSPGAVGHERPTRPPIGHGVGRSPTGGAREVVDCRSASGLAVIGELVSSRESVLVVCADALWRRGIVESAVHPGRYAGAQGAIIAARGSLSAADGLKRRDVQRNGPSDEPTAAEDGQKRGDIKRKRRSIEGAGLVLTVEASGGSGVEVAGLVLVDWTSLSLLPDLPQAFRHVVVADPAPHPDLAQLVSAGEGYVHVLAFRRELSQGAVASALPDRNALADVYRALSSAGGSLESAALRTALCGASGSGRSSEACGLALRVLAEIGVVRITPSGHAIRAESVSSVRGDLSSSMSFRLIEKANEECVRYLSQPEKQSSSPLEAAA